MKSSSRVAHNRRDLFRRLPDMDLLFLLETAEIEVQRVVSHELGRRRIKSAVPLLLRRLTSVDPRLRESAADALGMIGDPNAGHALLDLFADGAQPEEIRDTCAYALGRLAFRPALPTLLAGLADPSPTVRCCVVAALAAIAEAKVREAVEIALATEQNGEAKRAMQGLIEALPKTPKVSYRIMFMGSPEYRPHQHWPASRLGQPETGQKDLLPNEEMLNIPWLSRRSYTLRDIGAQRDLERSI